MLWCTTLGRASRWRTSRRWRRRGLVATNVLASGVHDASARNIIWGRMAAPPWARPRLARAGAGRLVRLPNDSLTEPFSWRLTTGSVYGATALAPVFGASRAERISFVFLYEYHRSGAARAPPLGAGRARIERQVLLRRRVHRSRVRRPRRIPRGEEAAGGTEVPLSD